MLILAVLKYTKKWIYLIYLIYLRILYFILIDIFFEKNWIADFHEKYLLGFDLISQLIKFPIYMIFGRLLCSL